MNPFFTPLLRRIYVFTACILFTYGAIFVAERSSWNKERLYRHLVSGNRDQRVRAAARLVVVRGQKQLLRALRGASPDAREVATNALWELWFRAAGHEAYLLAHEANEAMNRNDLSEAMSLLDTVVQRYPSFAEGWNRRALLLWQTGHYAQSINACQRVVALNPNHFGAWQGMGLSQIHLGDFNGACRSFAAALRLKPHDDGLRRVLDRCQSVRHRGTRSPRYGEAYL